MNNSRLFPLLLIPFLLSCTGSILFAMDSNDPDKLTVKGSKRGRSRERGRSKQEINKKKAHKG